ncbi:hypothetical protein [Actinomadura geliboluensis]|uniref:hypothetical protein n=1 Tax=Actinomadura geliboluensis TaxID=882440 RepID=UPI00372135B0
MNLQYPIDPVERARAMADFVEQMAQELGRAVVAVQQHADNLKLFCEVVSPLIRRLKATLGDPPANV